MASSPKEQPKIYSLEDIEKVVSTPAFRTKLIAGIRDGFVAYENGEFYAAPIQTLGLPPFPFVDVIDYAAQTCVKSGYFKGHEHYVIKVASGGYPIPSESRELRNELLFATRNTMVSKFVESKTNNSLSLLELLP